ncbi:MAG TPA: hypothetical protein VK877_15370, partial [Pseudolabrys sp.]|nr:hypothetical protein [Pseudolabrys sp.]
RTLGVPELAGIASYKEALKIGYSVDESVRRLLRYHWVERRLARIVLVRIAETPEWEVKGGFALHQWADLEHAAAVAERIREMRHPAPRMDEPPDPALELFLQEVEQAQDTVELLAGAYRVARADLVMAYRGHIDAANPLVDYPTRRALRLCLQEEEEALGWGARALGALIGRNHEIETRVRAWERHLHAFLGNARGIAGDLPPNTGITLPPRRAVQPRKPDFRPRRDARFEGLHNFSFPPHTVYDQPHISPQERNLALLCKRLLEMDVPEMMCSFLAEEVDRSTEFQRDFARQLWDEARHSMMGEVIFEARGVDWTRIPLNIGFSLRLNLHATPEERRLLLYAIEQSLMPGETGKKAEYETAAAAGDQLSAHFHDFDWADEVLHAQIGRKWLKADGADLKTIPERARAIHEQTWQALEAYKTLDEQDAEWWKKFVREVLHIESAATARELNPDHIKVVSSS